MSTSPTAPLRIRRFRVLWLASVFSNIGSFLQTVAASWLMLQLTGSPLWVGLMAASGTLPLLLLALPAGALADIVDRRRILIASQTLMAVAALAMAGLWYAGWATPGRVLAAGLLLGVGSAFMLPAWQALVPDLVPRELVPGAVALNSAGFNVARALGPAIGGVLVAAAGPGSAFLVNAASFVAVLGAAAALPRPAFRDDAESSLVDAIALGVRYARYTAPFRWLLAVAAAFALTTSVIQALLPNLTDALGGGAAAYGLLLGAMGGGALVGAFTQQRVNHRLGRAMVPAAITVFGLAGVAVGLSRPIPLTASLLGLAGVAWVWTLATLNATAQLLAPPWVRGRVMSLYTLAFVGFLPLGAILAGGLGALVGTPGAFVALSAGTVLLGLVAFRMPLPVLGEVVPWEPPEDWQPGSHAFEVEGGPVTVVTTWVIDEHELDEFLQVMDELRLVRLRTGAYRWRLYRNVGDPHRMTELFVLTSWRQHLRQHRRLDRQAVATIQRAHAFDRARARGSDRARARGSDRARARGSDRADGPVTHHLVAVDVDPARRPGWEQLVAVHERLHRQEGSGPVEGADRPADGLTPQARGRASEPDRPRSPR